MAASLTWVVDEFDHRVTFSGKIEVDDFLSLGLDPEQQDQLFLDIRYPADCLKHLESLFRQLLLKAQKEGAGG